MTWLRRSVGVYCTVLRDNVEQLVKQFEKHLTVKQEWFEEYVSCQLGIVCMAILAWDLSCYDWSPHNRSPGPVMAAAGSPLDHLWHFRWSDWTIDGAIVSLSLVCHNWSPETAGLADRLWHFLRFAVVRPP